MSLPISKSEVDAIVAELILGGEGDTEEEARRDLAKRAAHAFLDAREARRQYTVLVVPATEGPKVPIAFDAFASLDSAAKAVWNEKVPGLAGDTAYVIPHYPRWEGPGPIDPIIKARGANP